MVEGSPEVLGVEKTLWVLFKPSGMPVHATHEQTSPDLMTWAIEAAKAPPTLAPIHRLDRGASGLVLCSADADERRHIGELFSSGQVHKVYRALVIGHTHNKGVLRRPLKDARRKKKLPSVTRYRLLGKYPKTSLLAVWPETGRKHQIRRHLQGIGHPIVGDDRYPPRRFTTVPGFPGRLWLHAFQLELPDGRMFESPLPPELVAHLELLERKASIVASV